MPRSRSILQRLPLRLPLLAALLAASPPVLAQDAALFQAQCGSCHAVEAATGHTAGPNLAGLFGRKAGKAADWEYSAELAAADWVWDAARLDAWLTEPKSIAASTYMLYRQEDPAIRQAVIAYLLSEPALK